ncbi:MAG: DNA repair protein RecN, partial [Magnetococcales bacterium]|nr:DNA repair protein RecN [Magnetococcales bacterium]
NELEQADIEPGEFAKLEGRHKQLRHAVTLAEAADQCLELLSAAPDRAASETTGRAAGQLENGADIDPELGPIAESVRALQYEIDAAVERIERYREALETEPQALMEVEERRHQMRTLARKHRKEPDELPALLEQWRQELEALDRIEQDTSQREQELAKALAVYHERASVLSTLRRACAKRLTQQVTGQLAELVMANTRFETRVEPRDDGTPRADGLDRVQLMLAANPGEPMRTLAKAASGGELSRIMLALKSVLADAVSTPTLIFDEVDVGVGGKSAAAIGAKLAQLAQERQVLAITHLPQVAAFGAAHLKVEKQSDGERTRVLIEHLNAKNRVEELARMLAGTEITGSARCNAEDLIRDALA